MENKVLVLQTQSFIEETIQKSDLNLPVLMNNKILLSPGIWNGLNFTSEEIQKAFLQTDWKNKYNYALIYDHDEKAVNWLGNVLNLRYENGSLVGDLELWDEDLVRKLVLGKAKLGISARVLGMEDDAGNFVNFTFNNFSVVYDPACKDAYLNLSKRKLEEGITGSNETKGASIGSSTTANTNQKIKYEKGKKKDEKDKEDVEALSQVLEDLGKKFDEAIEKIKDSLRKQHPKWDDKKITSTAHAIATERKIPKDMFKSNLHTDERGFIKKSMTEEKIEETKTEESNVVEESKVEEPAKEETTEETPSEETSKVVEEVTEEVKEEAKEETSELSNKLDKILSSIVELSERISKLETKEEPKKDKEDKDKEDPKKKPVEEPAKEDPKKLESQELASKKALSQPAISQKKENVSFLLGKRLSDKEQRLAEVLLKNASKL